MSKIELGQMRSVIGSIRDKLDDLEDKITRLGQSSAPKSGWQPGIKRCWKRANDAYERARKKLPAGHHTMSEIYEEAKKDPLAQIPKTCRTFASYVQQYRKRKNMDSHRKLNRQDL
jgi:hypothetical protein